MKHPIARWTMISAIAFGFVATVHTMSARSLEPSFVMADVAIHEADTGSTPAVLTFSLVSPAIAHGDINLIVSTLAETATEGIACSTPRVDFIGAHGRRLTLSSRQNSAHISVQVCGDLRFEPNETFLVRVLDSTGQAVLAKSHVTIVENDAAPLPWVGMAAQGTIAKSEEQRWQTPDLPAGDYVFTLGNGTGDSDLYVRIGAAPTLTVYDCRPAKSSVDEACTVSITAPDVVYVMVRGYATSSTFKLRGSAR